MRTRPWTLAAFLCGLISLNAAAAMDAPDDKPWRFEDFSAYDVAEELRAVWTPFDENNPAPRQWDAHPADGDEPAFLRLQAGADQGFSLLIRAGRVPDGFRPGVLRLRLRGAPANAGGLDLCVSVRPDRDTADYMRRVVPVVGSSWRTVEVPAEELIGQKDFQLLLWVLNAGGAPARVDVAELEFLPLVPAAPADTPEAKAARRAKLLGGRMVQFDSEFAYYRDRSTASIADELRLNGFDAVYYVVMRREKLRYEVAPAIQAAGLGLGVMVGPAMINLSEDELDALLPAKWREWKMEFTQPRGMDPYIFIGMVYPEYNAWFKTFIADIARRLDLDGFTFAEVHYPNYDGPDRDPPFLADVAPNYQKAFMRDTGAAAFPDFSDPSSPHYYKTDAALYRKLLDYRVENCNAFYDDLVNGPGGLRENFPGIVFATWTLGTSEADGPRKIRDWEGNDLASMIARVKPDIHFVQTHAPDWLNPEFTGDYIDLYRPFFDEIRRVAPGLPIGFQGDFGSRPPMRRNPEWVERFYKAAERNGVDATTYYEFCLRWEVYNTPPRPLEATRAGARSVRLAFDQRLGQDAAKAVIGRELAAGDTKARVEYALTDGHWLFLELDRDLPEGYAGEVVLPVEGVMDDPGARLALSNAEPFPYGPVNALPPGSEARLPLRVVETKNN